MTGDDPVRVGLVASLARPGGNLTGIGFLTTELAAKRLELLRELLPKAARVAILVNPASAAQTEATLREVEPAARTMGLQIQVFNANTSREIGAAFQSMELERPDGLFVAPDPFFAARRVQLAHLATRYAVPAIYVGREFVEAGGLMSYGANIADAWREGIYTGRILKGTKPADLPVVQSSKFLHLLDGMLAREHARAIGFAQRAQKCRANSPPVLQYGSAPKAIDSVASSNKD
jgi:putative tryptophan/tyrosine transport system substrate-binding protein